MCPSRLAYSKVCVPWDLSSYIGGSITPGRSNQAEQTEGERPDQREGRRMRPHKVTAKTHQRVIHALTATNPTPSYGTDSSRPLSLSPLRRTSFFLILSSASIKYLELNHIVQGAHLE
uniref:Uncharacterized protein n=2 Tax=Arion vulgaris TaxID=1028688 RepID=A0A0B7BQE4_9EUPU